MLFCCLLLCLVFLFFVFVFGFLLKENFLQIIRCKLASFHLKKLCVYFKIVYKRISATKRLWCFVFSAVNLKDLHLVLRNDVNALLHICLWFLICFSKFLKACSMEKRFQCSTRRTNYQLTYGSHCEIHWLFSSCIWIRWIGAFFRHFQDTHLK